jgi:hypothetical protein
VIEISAAAQGDFFSALAAHHLKAKAHSEAKKNSVFNIYFHEYIVA